MTFPLTRLFAAMTFICFSSASYAQVSVTATAGQALGNYTTLKGAFDAINQGMHQGQINISINGSTTEAAEAVLQGNGGMASYTSVNITPTVAATISGSIAGALVRLDSAHNVTIDGRIGGTGSNRDLTFQNSYTGTAAKASVIRMMAGAKDNVIRYANIEGVGQPGMDNTTVNIAAPKNTIEYNDIHSYNAQWPKTAMMLKGDSIQVTGNNIHDFISRGIWVNPSLITGANGMGITIRGNSLYHTDTIHTSTNFIGQVFINVENGVGLSIVGNYFGGSAAGATGAPCLYTKTALIEIIDVSLGSGRIDSNVITNIRRTYTSTTSLANNQFWCIDIQNWQAPGFNIKGNIIGSMTDTGAIGVIGDFYGIMSAVAGAATKGNQIGGVSIYGVLAGASFSGIGGGNATLVENNTVGGTVPGSIKNYAVNGMARGIWMPAGTECKRNIIRNISNAYPGSPGSSANVYGIDAFEAGGTGTITGNSIYALSGDTAIGIHMGGFFGGTYQGNVSNNMISMDAAPGSLVCGISDRGTIPASHLSVYNNSIVVSGSSGNTDMSVCLNFENVGTPTLADLLNNLFINNASGPGGNYSMIAETANLVLSDHNNIYSSGASSVVWNNSLSTLGSYQAASGKDGCSVGQLADFSAASSGDLHLQNTPNNQLLIGQPVQGVTTDVDGDPRNLLPAMGADELLLSFTPVTIATTADTIVICNQQPLMLLNTSAVPVQWYKDGAIIPGATQDTFYATQTGTYQAVYVNGCASVFSKAVYGLATVINNNVVVNASSAQTIQGAGNFQWLDCNNGQAAIPGATSNIFTATQSGYYSVAIDLGGCRDTSACVFISALGINNLPANTDASIYPNPGRNQLNIHFAQAPKNAAVTVTDALGVKVQEVNGINAGDWILDTRTYSAGIYFIQIREGAATETYKWMKN